MLDDFAQTVYEDLKKKHPKEAEAYRKLKEKIYKMIGYSEDEKK